MLDDGLAPRGSVMPRVTPAAMQPAVAVTDHDFSPHAIAAMIDDDLLAHAV